MTQDDPDLEYPPPLPIANALDWADHHNPHEEGTYDWYIWSIRFWVDQSEKERRRSVWISRIALILVVVGAAAEFGGLLITLIVDFRGL